MMNITSVSVCAFALFVIAQAQIMPLYSQTDTWNSSFQFDPSQLTGANLSDTQASNIEIALRFERTDWATGSVKTDDFYTAPLNSSFLPPGSAVKIQPFLNTTNFTLAPNIALSRILYITQNPLNENIPASAIILWPFLPAQYPNLTAPNPLLNSSRFPLVAWLHGTSGVFAECGPSHIRNLWYQYSAIYELALSGYVVVAPDYQGLGVNETANGTEIVHPYLFGPAAANDVFYAIQATQEAFSHLVSKEFVIMGHSQGGAAAWAAAARQKLDPVDGYLGTIAGSPPTNLSGLIAASDSNGPPTLPFLLAQAVRSLYPSFDDSAMMTPEGIARLQLAKEQSMCNSAVGEILADFPGPDNGTLIHTNWTNLPEFQEYLLMSALGTQPIVGPMLVLQGTADPSVPYQLTDVGVSQACTANSGKGIQYARFDGVSHVPVLYASRTIWLEFLRERFSSAGTGGKGTGVDEQCVTTNYTSLPMPVENYQKELGYFLSLATAAYEVA